MAGPRRAGPGRGARAVPGPTLGLWFTADRVAEDGPVVDAVRRAFLAGARGYALACRALEQADVTGVLDRITAPTLVAARTTRRPSPRRRATSGSGCLTPRGVALPARHAGVLEQPDQFRDALLGFLGEDRAEVSR